MTKYKCPTTYTYDKIQGARLLLVDELFLLLDLTIGTFVVHLFVLLVSCAISVAPLGNRFWMACPPVTSLSLYVCLCLCL